MNKAEQREVTKTLALLNAKLIAPDIAATTLATLHRGALTKRTQRQLVEIMDREALTQYLFWENGCLVPRFDRRADRAAQFVGMQNVGGEQFAAYRGVAL